MRAILLALALACIGCQGGLDEPRAEPALDEPFFRCNVQPILTKSCSQLACHGDGKRFFRVFARNRMRAGGEEKDRNAALTDAERRANYEAARAFVDPASPETSLLVLKPVDQRGGGYFHRGAEIFGKGNVFLTRDDPDMKTLRTWALGKKEDPRCVEIGSDR